MNTNDINKISEYYNIRGQKAKDADHACFGSKALPIYVSTPFYFVECDIIKNLKRNNGNFLDLCCGTGIHSILPAMQGWNVVANDISNVSLDAAKKLARKNNASHKIEFKFEEAKKLITSFKKNSFDIVYIAGSLYYLDYELTVSEIKRILKNSGKFYCIETYKHNLFMNVVRFAKYHLKKNRDKRTLNHLLGKKDINKIMNYFECKKVIFFDCFTLLGKFLPNKIRQNYNDLAKRIDFILLNRLKLDFLSFKFVIVAKKGRDQ